MEKIEIGVNVVNNASKQLSNVATDVTTFKRTIDGATKSVDGFDRVIQKFSLQAFAQGVLNVSTSAAQLVTSFSNLDRVANQVAASTVALHKAEDQILRKQTQLSQAIEKYGSNSERAAMITGELATAQDQLAVKTERVKLAQDQQNDTYILMASNITNTVFGSLQTLGALKTMLIAKYTASIAVTTLDSAATNANAHIHSFNAAQVALAGAAKAGAIAPTLGYTGAVVGNTAATAAFTTVLWASLRAMIVHPFFAPAVLAALAIGVVAYSAHIDNLNKTMKQSTVSITDGSSAGYGFGEMANFTSPNIDGLSTSVFNLGESYTVAAEKVVNASKVIQQRSGRFGGTTGIDTPLDVSLPNLQGRRFNKGTSARPTNTLASPVAEQYTVEKFTAIMAQTKDASDFSSVISDIQPYLTTLNRIKDTVIALRNSYDDLNGVQTGQATEMAIQKMHEQNTALGLTDAMVRNLITHNKDLGDIQDTNYKNEKSNLRRLAEIKKKLISDYGFTRQGSNRESFIAGDTNYFMGESGIPFSGYINKKTNDVAIAIEHREAFDSIMAALDWTQSQVSAGVITPNQASRIMSDLNNAFNNTRNITSAYKWNGESPIKPIVTQTISGIIDKMRATGKFSNLDNRFSNMKIFNPVSGELTSTGQYFRDTASLSYARLQAQYYEKNKPNINIRNQSNSNPYGNYANPGFATGKPSNSARFKIDASFGIARRAKDAFANSAIGQSIFAARSLLTGGSFAYSGSAGRAAAKSNSFDSTSLMMAGLLGFYPSDDSSVSSMVQESVDFLASNMSSIPTSMRNSAFASILRNSVAKDAYILPMGYSYLRDQRSSKLGDERARSIRASKAGMLNTLINRFNTGNYGEYDATLMQVLLSGDFAHPELQQEYNSFQSNIAPKLGISFSQFGSTLSDTQRGYNEIDDRLRYYDRLAAISTGATAF